MPSLSTSAMRGWFSASAASAWLASLRRLNNMAQTLSRTRWNCHFATPPAGSRGDQNFMHRVLSVAAERFPIAGTFTISRGSKTEAEVIRCSILENGFTGHGECVPYRHYGETVESVAAAIKSIRNEIVSGASR